MHSKYLNLSKFNRAICFIFLIVISTFFISSIYSYDKFAINKNSYVLNKNTSVKINNSDEQIVNLQGFSFDALNKGDTLEIKKDLNCDLDITHPVICFLVYHAVIDCYLDDELIYTYGHEKYDQNLSVGSNYFRIPLPDNYKGKTLKIKLTVTENNAFSSIYNVVLQSERDSYSHFIFSKLYIILIAVPMFFMGFICLVISVIKPFKTYKSSNLTYIALFSIFLSMWILSSNQIIQLFTDNLQMTNIIEYMSMYISPIPLLLFFYKMQSIKLYKKLSFILFILYAIFNIVVIITVSLNYGHLCDFLNFFQITTGLASVFLGYITLRKHKQKSEHEKILTYGIILMLFIFSFDIIRFNLEKYEKITAVQLQISFVPFGAFILVATFMYSYGIELLNSLYKNVERQALLKLAYIDALTKIPNRTKCESVINELEHKLDKTVTIISLDLNNLKYVNDTYGHQFGDEMISSFSTILYETFISTGFVARMGGDEFIAIFQDVSSKKIDSLIKNLLLKLYEFNSTTKANYKLSVAYGHYTRNVNENSSLWKTYEFADKLMYKNKKAQKKFLKLE